MSVSGNGKQIGFIGLGVMGREMSRNLLRGGYSVSVYDIDAGAVDALVDVGATRAGSVAEALADADMAITMLPDTPHVEDVLFGEDGILACPPKGMLYADMSTISPGATKRMQEALSARGVVMLDAPVSGGPQGAKDATLSIMVGGAAGGFYRAEPVFRAMGTTVTHVGQSGAGQTVKLCNQLVCGINLQAICEALALVRGCGVDLDQMRTVLLGGSASSWMLDRLGPSMIAGDVAAGFRIDLMLKDLRLVLEMAQEQAVPLPATSLVTTQYMDARAHGEGGNGNQALFRVYDRMTAQDRPAVNSPRVAAR